MIIKYSNEITLFYFKISVPEINYRHNFIASHLPLIYPFRPFFICGRIRLGYAFVLKVLT
jgi:hypothetical protein